MTGNLFRALNRAARTVALGGGLLLTAGCGTILAGPGETINIQPLAGEDLAGACTFDINMPDDPLGTANGSQDPSKPAQVEVGALVIYQRGDSGTLFQDAQIQSMAATLHLVTVFAHQCNAKSYADIQSDAGKGPGRALLAALSQYAADTKHAEIANIKLVLTGFSAAGVLSITMAQDFPSRVMTLVPYASGSAYFNLDTVGVSGAMAQIPTLVLANAYDSASGDQKSLRYFQRGWFQGAPWALAVQNHTDHCCVLSTRDILIPWVNAIVTESTPSTNPLSTLSVVSANPFALPAVPTVSFTTFTDGWPDGQGELDFWISIASQSPPPVGGPNGSWLPDTATTQAWYQWVTSPGTN